MAQKWFSKVFRPNRHFTSAITETAYKRKDLQARRCSLPTTINYSSDSKDADGLAFRSRTSSLPERPESPTGKQDKRNDSTELLKIALSNSKENMAEIQLQSNRIAKEECRRPRSPSDPDAAYKYRLSQQHECKMYSRVCKQFVFNIVSGKSYSIVCV